MDNSEKLEAYYAKEHKFKKGIALLRSLALKANAEETYKWSSPVYGVNGKNVFWISRFNNHFGVGFFNGVFLKDPLKVLINVQEEKTQAMRHWRFTNNEEIDKKGVLAYIKESLKNQKKRMVLSPKKKTKKDIEVLALLHNAFTKNTKIAAAFANLTLYKQREYSEYISTAKQEKTKLTRLEKILPMIESGKGLNDKYK